MDDLSKLIDAAKGGDKDAFGKIYNLFYPRIFRYCHFNTKKEDLAHDFCQETFLRAWKNLTSFSHKKGGSFQAYLFKIARNLIIDHSRKKKEVPIEKAAEVQSEEDLEGGLDEKQNQIKVQNALEKLSDLERQVIILRYFEEMTTYEVAKAVGIREGALRVRLHRILKKLKGIIEK